MLYTSIAVGKKKTSFSRRLQNKIFILKKMYKTAHEMKFNAVVKTRAISGDN